MDIDNGLIFPHEEKKTGNKISLLLDMYLIQDETHWSV